MTKLTPYQGQWTESQARHLLRRTVFGVTNRMAIDSVNMGLTETLNTLFARLPTPAPPLKSIPDGTGSNRLDDPGAAYGETWVDAPAFPNVSPPMYRNRVLRSRSKSLYSWTILQIFESGMNIREKMALFWHNHFVVGQSVIPHREYKYYSLLRSHATGNVVQLTKDITVDTSMLIYLSGAENTDSAPNENFSRELLELFAIGKGPLAAPGDYTHYTESDVIAIAQVLTGWRVPPASSADTLTASFDERRHSTGSKSLSHRFNNRVITNNGADEYKNLIDIIFEKEECSKFICRELYRWFVSAEITEHTENSVIDEMATILRMNEYEVEPALRALLGSTHFFEQTACLIKSPLDLVMSASRALNVEPPIDNLEARYDHAYNYYVMAADIEQALFQHPDVAGWKAYYQEPQRDRLWINNLLLPKRHEFCALLVEGGRFTYKDEPYEVREPVAPLLVFEHVSDPSDITSLINGIATQIFNYPINEKQVAALKEVLIPGLPDYEWTLEYNKHVQDLDNVGLRESISKKVRNLLSVMVRMSEFQVM